MKARELLTEQFGDFVRLEEKRPNIQQVYAPLYHEDGDMIDIFLDIPRDADLDPQQTVRLSDHGLSLMRLSYHLELDTQNKQKVFRKLLVENGLSEAMGELYLDTRAGSLYPALMQFSHAIAKVCNLRILKRETVAELFYEMLNEAVVDLLRDYNPVPRVCPIDGRDDLEADWELTANGIPVYLFGIKDTAKARLATLTCQAYQLNKLRFQSAVVHEDFGAIPRKDIARLTSACDKQFPSLADFREHSQQFMARISQSLKS